MIIYRVESPAGMGVYYTGAIGAIISATGSRFHDPLRHPQPESDGLPETAWKKLLQQGIVDAEDIQFGFATWVQLTRWFLKPIRNTLRQHNIQVSKYHVEHNFVCIGVSQVIFARSKATLVSIPEPVITKRKLQNGKTTAIETVARPEKNVLDNYS